MARKDKLIKSKSIYTVRRKHQVLSAGTVYENDHITIIPNDGIYNDEMTLFSDSNFKYRIRLGDNNKKRHVRGGWVKPTNSEDEIWTLANVSSTTESNESKIITKPNYSSLKDFAYYGSASELIRATVNDIIARFPGGLGYYDFKDAPIVTVDGEEYCLISNEFDIDFWTGGEVASGSVKNPMRVLAASYMNYTQKDGQILPKPNISITGNCFNSIVATNIIIGQAEGLSIYKDGEGKLYLISDKSNAQSNSGQIICRPKQEFIDKFWDEIDDFERVLLDRDSSPIYKATFDTPYFTETGYYYKPQDYVWPTVESGDDAFTPDITSAKFQGYIQSLISLAEFHDEFDSDNIWRMMTHEAIKNLDWTFINEKDGETEDATNIDSSRMQAMLRIYGRQFDDIKRYADNIKATNNISYDEKNNMPDYFLSDILENDGWQSKSVSPTDGDNVRSSEYTISNVTVMKSGKTGSDVNIKFAQRLALSSDFIQSMKGTRVGIKTILGMFGYTEASALTKNAGEYYIEEYVRDAQNFPSYTQAAYLRGLGEYIYGDESTNLMEGYPVAIIDPKGNSEGESNYYIVPWYDKSTNYIYPLYFQSKGGWGKWPSKSINIAITSATTLSEGNNVRIYEETEPYMRFANNIDSMLEIPNTDVFDEMVCYVTDISDLYNGYSASTEDSGNKDFSHYFVLKNVALSSFVGFINNEYYSCYGWRNVFIHEYDGSEEMSDDGKRVVYLESLLADYKGNNPHNGKGKYDDGLDYVNRYNHIFSEALKTGNYDYLKTEDCDNYKALATSGFDMTSLIVDNKKCHYFSADTASSVSLEYSKGKSESESVRGRIGVDELHEVLSTPSNWDIKKYNPSLKNPKELSNAWDESSTYAIMNVKNLFINFGTGKNEHFRKYIQNVVLKYIEEMIPSTAILAYQFDDEEATFALGERFGGISKLTNITADMAISVNDNQTYWDESVNANGEWIRASDLETI